MGLTTASTTLTIILYFILTIILYIILTIILYIILTIILYIIGEYHGHDDDDDDDTILGAFQEKEPNGANGRSQRGSARGGAQRMFEKKRKEADDGSLLGTFR